MSWPDSRWETGLTAGPHQAVTLKHGPTLSSAAAKGRGVRRWLPCLGHEVGRAGKKGEKGKQAAGGGGKKWAEPETVMARGNIFPFFFPAFTQTF